MDDRQEERRLGAHMGRRYAVTWRMIARNAEAAIEGTVLNVSMTGVLILVPPDYEPGSTIFVEIRPNPDIRIGALLEIAREHEVSENGRTYGARIINQTPMDRRKLRAILRALPG